MTSIFLVLCLVSSDAVVPLKYFSVCFCLSSVGFIFILVNFFSKAIFGSNFCLQPSLQILGKWLRQVRFVFKVSYQDCKIAKVSCYFRETLAHFFSVYVYLMKCNRHPYWETTIKKKKAWLEFHKYGKLFLWDFCVASGLLCLIALIDVIIRVWALNLPFYMNNSFVMALILILGGLDSMLH